MSETVMQTKNLRKSFGALRATDDVSIDLRRGEIHAIIGPNGAGKSTVIQQITGALQPDGGTVHFLGQNVTSLPVAARAKLGLGRTFQISALATEDTVIENALLGAIGAYGNTWQIWRPAQQIETLRERAEDGAMQVFADNLK